MDKIGELLADLREEQIRLRLELGRVTRIIDALETAIGIAERPERDAVAQPAPPPAPAPKPYAQLDVYEATAAYLATVSEPKTARQIADALRAGGFKTRSIDFPGTVRTMLRRQPTRGIRQTSDGKRWTSS